MVEILNEKWTPISARHALSHVRKMTNSQARTALIDEIHQVEEALNTLKGDIGDFEKISLEETKSIKKSIGDLNFNLSKAVTGLNQAVKQVNTTNKNLKSVEDLAEKVDHIASDESSINRKIFDLQEKLNTVCSDIWTVKSTSIVTLIAVIGMSITTIVLAW